MNVLWESWLRTNVYKVVVTLNFKHFPFIKYINCMFWCVFLVNILKYGKISFLRVSVYSVHLVILQSYTQNVSWSMFYYPVMGVIEVKMILREDSIKIGKIAFLWWVRIKPKVLNIVFLFRWPCFLLWNKSGEILSIITILLS